MYQTSPKTKNFTGGTFRKNQEKLWNKGNGMGAPEGEKQTFWTSKHDYHASRVSLRTNYGKLHSKQRNAWLQRLKTMESSCEER